ncbi:DNA integrity scanning protein DisA nucleotide-binding domain protein [Halogeometricum sp. S1BR25-6]|uniref:DNA integrity scanning protein DisA nucleotide-binding domain protein n=1 Tax=Halogeometricum salsisoli TaxID=2950536 RepID=A0ABU2GL13_9EURY|nr:diadenylate cyclase [Halogeometricum sp. S1BR25-6]MDS0301086.1 DNA integrity scanning protein DisA nucleotide-binding domain protein [Halogeometricum sp. S1BR25-6]
MSVLHGSSEMSELSPSSVASELKSTSTDLDAVLERIEKCVGEISHRFGRWDDPYARGPGLYFVVERDSMAEFAAPMGTNRWPVEDCGSVFSETDVFLETAQKVALSCDGAVVVRNDGTIREEMVRVKQLSADEYRRINDLPYAEWMGTRHMSALETSVREEVIAAVTLSEENGRVTVFIDGAFEDSPAAFRVTD